ncbi:hypothetical protein [Pseudoxanthomonas mexicana]
MEFICRFHHFEELSRIRALLRSKGIPTFSPAVESHRMGAQWALFVCIKEQAEDARRIIRNPNHEPSLVVNAEEFEATLETPDHRLIAKWATVTFLTVVALFAGLMYVFFRWGQSGGP